MSKETRVDPKVSILSEPKTIRMADDWFGFANLDHFWIHRRFVVAKKLLGGSDVRSKRLVEIGCGHGLVQRQLEDHFGIPVDGIDLNLPGLQQSVVRSGRLFYYDITERRPEFREAYDVVILFDVLEHLEDELNFLNAVMFCLRPGGRLLINVPALQMLWSAYDRVQGHVRRYTLGSLVRVLDQAGLRMLQSTYWGMPLVPLLLLRKIRLLGVRDDAVNKNGFGLSNQSANAVLKSWSNFEPIPQRFIGTSVMALCEKPDS